MRRPRSEGSKWQCVYPPPCGATLSASACASAPLPLPHRLEPLPRTSIGGALAPLHTHRACNNAHQANISTPQQRRDYESNAARVLVPPNAMCGRHAGKAGNLWAADAKAATGTITRRTDCHRAACRFGLRAARLPPTLSPSPMLEPPCRLAADVSRWTAGDVTRTTCCREYSTMACCSVVASSSFRSMFTWLPAVPLASGVLAESRSRAAEGVCLPRLHRRHLALTALQRDLTCCLQCSQRHARVSTT